MNQTYTAAERRFATMLKSLPCVVCKRMGLPLTKHAELHHISHGSSRQNNWLVAPLCHDHHDPYKTGSGLHGMGAARFCAAFKVPHGIEYGLLAWVNEDVQERLGLKAAA